MAAEPKLAQSGGKDGDSTSVPPNFSDLLKSENGTLDDRVGSLDARAQSALLQEAFEAPLTPGSESPTRQPAAANSKWMRRAVKSAIGLAIIAVVGVGPMQRLFAVSRLDAVVNARLFSLRAAI